MKYTLPPKVFITGTDTHIGKTVVSAILMAGLKGKYWKPVQSGLKGITDTQWVRKTTGLPEPHFHPEQFRLHLPLSPHASARRDGVRINMEAFTLPDPYPFNHLIVEGAGGIMVPLNDRHFMLDLMEKLGIPVLLVASSQLGTINHTLLSLDVLRSRRLDIAGVVMNGPLNYSNRQAIEQFGKTRVIAEIDLFREMSISALEKNFFRFFENSDNKYAMTRRQISM